MKLKVALMADDAGLKKALSDTQKSIKNINVDSNRSNRIFKNVGLEIGNIGKTASGLKAKLESAFGVGKALMYFAAMLKMGKGLMGVIKTAMDGIETQHLFNIALGETAVASGEVVDKMSELYGLDRTNIQNAVGTFSLLARTMGFSNDQAKTMSLSIYQLGVDLASLVNVPFEQVMGDLKSGLLGQTETVYKYGIDVTEAALRQEALVQGMDKTIRQMSQGEKMFLRYSIMLKTTGLAQGDFARTLESPANQTKVLQQRIATLGRTIGYVLLPVIGTVLPYLNAFAILLTRVVQALAMLLGTEMPSYENTFGGASVGADDMSDALDNVGSSASGANKQAKELRATLLGIDELNIMNEQPKDTPSSGGGGGGGGGGGISMGDLSGFDIAEYNSLLERLPSKAEEIANRIQRIFKNSGWSGLGEYVGESIQNGFDKIDYAKIGQKLASGINDIIRFGLSMISQVDFVDLGHKFGTLLNNAVENIDAYALGQALNKKVKLGFQFLLGFVTEFNWNTLGEKIAEGVNGAISQIDPLTISAAIRGFAFGVFDTFQTAFENINWGDIVDIIETLVPDMFNTGGDLLDSFVDGFGDNKDDIILTAAKVVTTLIGELLMALPRLTLAGLKFLEHLTNGISDNKEKILESVKTVVYNFVDGLDEKLPQIFRSGMVILGNIIDGIIFFLPELIFVAFDVVQTLVDDLVENMPYLIDAGGDMLANLIYGILTSLPKMVLAGNGVYSSFTDGIEDNMPNIFDLGVKIIKALVFGIIDGIKEFFTPALNLAKDTFSLFGKKLTDDSADVTQELKDLFESTATAVDYYSGNSTRRVTDDSQDVRETLLKDLGLASTSTTKHARSISRDWTTSMDDLSGETRITMQSILDEIDSNMGSASTSAVTSSKRMSEGVNTEFDGISKKSSVALKLTQTQTSTSMDEITKSFSKGFGTINTDTTKNLNDVSKTYTSTLGTMKKSTDSDTKVILSAIKSMFETMGTYATNGTNTYSNNFNTGMSKAVSTAKSTSTQITNSFKTLYNDMYNAGVNAGLGFYNGLNSKTASIKSLSSSIGTSVSQGVKRALEVRSPSRVMDWVGQMTVNPFEKRLSDSVVTVGKIAENLGEAAIPDVLGNTRLMEAELGRMVNTGVQSVGAKSLYNVPQVANNEDEYENMYKAMSDALREVQSDSTINLYVDGVYSGTVEKAKRKNLRAGRVVMPVGV